MMHGPIRIRFLYCNLPTPSNTAVAVNICIIFSIPELFQFLATEYFCSFIYLSFVIVSEIMLPFGGILTDGSFDKQKYANFLLIKRKRQLLPAV